MKKTALFITCALMSAVSFSQVSSIKKDSTGQYKSDPSKLYSLALTSEQIASLLQTSQAGVVPFLKTIKLPMDKLDEAQSYFNILSANITMQYRRQYVADSLKQVKPITKK